MSDFFSDIYGAVRMPDSVMNDGPLPPMSTSGMPAGLDGSADASINSGTALLSDMDPYAYGEANRLSTQTAYLNIPHVVQRIVPSVMLPEATPYDQGGGMFSLAHQVDDGDIAFVIRAMFSPFDIVQVQTVHHLL